MARVTTKAGTMFAAHTLQTVTCSC